jgi:hypothetical protein
MSDSNVRDRLDVKHEPDRERRFEAIKRWVSYIESEPPEKWGPQQNAIVDDQLESAQDAGLSASHRRRVEELAEDIATAKDRGQESK